MGVLGAAGVVLTPTHLLDTSASAHLYQHVLVHPVLVLVATKMQNKKKTQKKALQQPVVTLQEILFRKKKPFPPLCLKLSRFSFHLEITIIKFLGSCIEFESLYSHPPNLCLSPLLSHQQEPFFFFLFFHSPADFQLCCTCIFYIYRKICWARPVWKPETMKYVEMHFLITPSSQKRGEKKSAEIMSYYMVLKPPSQKQPVPFLF